MTDPSTPPGPCLSLAALERAALADAHLDHCPRCRARVRAIRRDNRMLLALARAGALGPPTAEPAESRPERA